VSRHEARDWRQRAAAVAAYRAAHGDWCPGWGVPGHPCGPPGSRNPLSADHIIPVALGGELFPGRYAVLCRACNARKGARLTPPAPPRTSRNW